MASIQFGIDNRTPISDDSMTLNRTVTSNGVVPDSQPRNGITIRNGDVHRFQQGAPMTFVNPNASAQLRDFGTTVEVAGYRVSPEVAATLQKQAPEIFEPANTPAPVEAPQAPAEEYHYPIENPIGAEVVRELAQANPSHQMSVLSAMLKGNAKAFEVATQRWSEATGEPVDMLRGKAQIAADAMSGQVRRLAKPAWSQLRGFLPLRRDHGDGHLRWHPPQPVDHWLSQRMAAPHWALRERQRIALMYEVRMSGFLPASPAARRREEAVRAEFRREALDRIEGKLDWARGDDKGGGSGRSHSPHGHRGGR